MSHIRAKLEVMTDIAKCTDVEATRYALGALHVCPGPDSTVYLSATNARILAVNMADGSSDGEQLVPAGLIAKSTGKDARRVELGERLEVTTGRGTRSKTVVGDAESVGRYPNLPDVFPEIPDASGWRVLTFDARELAKLAAAIATDGKISLLLAPPAAAPDDSDKDLTEWLTAIPVVADAGFGVAMPCTSDGCVIRRKSDDETETVTTTADSKIGQYRDRVTPFVEAFRAARAAKAQAEKVAAEESQAARAARL